MSKIEIDLDMVLKYLILCALVFIWREVSSTSRDVNAIRREVAPVHHGWHVPEEPDETPDDATDAIDEAADQEVDDE